MTPAESTELAEAVNAYNASVQEGVEGVLRWLGAGLFAVLSALAIVLQLLPMLEGL